MTDAGADRTVLFVCLHGAAKSVVAAAYLDRLARERGWPLRGDAAGLEPDAAIPARVVEGLLADGIDVRGRRPRAVTRDALASAWRVVTLGCDLGSVAPPGLGVTRWDDVPAVSDGFEAARAAIVQHLPSLWSPEDEGESR